MLTFYNLAPVPVPVIRNVYFGILARVREPVFVMLTMTLSI